MQWWEFRCHNNQHSGGTTVHSAQTKSNKKIKTRKRNRRRNGETHNIRSYYQLDLPSGLDQL